MKTILICLALMLGCVKKGNNPTEPSDHEKMLGSGAACTWLRGDSVNREVVCIVQGQRFICIKGKCAAVSSTPPEAQ